MNDMELKEYFGATNKIKFHHLDEPIYVFTQMMRCTFRSKRPH
jgi:hypothetical protein